MDAKWHMDPKAEPPALPTMAEYCAETTRFASVILRTGRALAIAAGKPAAEAAAYARSETAAFVRTRAAYYDARAAGAGHAEAAIAAKALRFGH